MSIVTLKIQRFDPEKDQRPYWATYQVEVEANDRLLDALHKVKLLILLFLILCTNLLLLIRSPGGLSCASLARACAHVANVSRLLMPLCA